VYFRASETLSDPRSRGLGTFVVQPASHLSQNSFAPPRHGHTKISTRRYPHEDIHTKTFTWRHANMTCRILDGRLRGAAVLLSTRYDACTSSAEWHREVYIRTRSKFPMKASHLLDKAQRSQIVSQISLNSLAVVSQILFCHHGHRRPSTLQPSGHPLALGRPFTRLT